MAGRGGGGQRPAEEPPTWLLYAGWAALLVEASGRWLGGRWSGRLTEFGAAAVLGGALAFFARLLTWRAGRQ